MARVKLTEYRAKTLLVERYPGAALHMASIDNDIKQLDENTQYVVKVDQGVKKRGKQGLIRFDVSKQTARQAVQELSEKGFERFIAEPMSTHEETDERYLSVERTREGMQFLYSPRGGVDVENHTESIESYSEASAVPLPDDFLTRIVEIMNQEQLSFVEINPLVVQGESCVILDAAVLADSAGAWPASWTEDDVVESTNQAESERMIAELNEGSAASFSFRLLNPDGAIWLLLSGGGASITIADEAANRNRAELIGNYGEYSGGPTREETQIYTQVVLEQMLASPAHPKALIIAGGVANFTDVKKTFSGVIDALTPHIGLLQKQLVKVYVRRGGPNEKEGLQMMEEFLKTHNIFGSVHGSDDVLTAVIAEALEYVDA